MNNKNIQLTVRQALFTLIVSWLYTLLAFYLPLWENHISLYEIYTFQGVPFALIVQIILYYYGKK